MSSVTDASAPKGRKAKRNTEPAFVVRAKSGPSNNAWVTLGFAWERENGQGYSIKLNALPIGTEWNGVLKLLPPYEAGEDDAPESE
jgi:hypothetical protein